MPKIPAEQISPYGIGAESTPELIQNPKVRRRGQPGAARAPPLVALLSGVQTARYLNISTRTLSRWVDQGVFPKPVYLRPGSPAKWRIIDLDNWISKCATARHQRPALRGALAHLAEAVK